MFIIRKILNGGSNVPEPILMPASANAAYRAGCALKIDSGVMVNAGSTDKPTFIAAEDAAKGEKSMIACYPIFTNMLIEVPLLGTPSTIKVGMKVTLVPGDGGFIDSVGNDTTGGVATVINMNGAVNSGDKIYVRFD